MDNTNIYISIFAMHLFLIVVVPMQPSEMTPKDTEGVVEPTADVALKPGGALRHVCV